MSQWRICKGHCAAAAVAVAVAVVPAVAATRVKYFTPADARLSSKADRLARL